MISLAVICVLLAGQPLQEPPPAGLHFVIERDFIYMASTNTMNTEQWIAGDRMYQKRGNRVVITRKDLGVRWTVDTTSKTYRETPLDEGDNPGGQGRASTPAAVPPPAGDLRVAGFTYDPVYDWTVTETGETQTINGLSCSQLTALGDADYSESKLSFWICPPAGSWASGFPNTAVLDWIRSDNIRRMLEDQLAKRGNPILMSVEENTEPAIAPTTIFRIRIKILESAPVPAGLFDLPPGIQKAVQPR